MGALSYWIHKYPSTLNEQFSKEFVLEATRFILENNNCKFNNEFFRQINGTAMKTVFAPTYATLSMEYFEVKFYAKINLEIGVESDRVLLNNWCRVLDDCKNPSDKTKINPNKLLEVLNSVNHSLHFTMQTSDKELPFLDILIR